MLLLLVAQAATLILSNAPHVGTPPKVLYLLVLTQRERERS